VQARLTQGEIVAVIPCYNEQETIYGVVKEVLKYVEKVVVINDGSLDKTEREAKRAGALVLNHTKNLGKGAALKTAFNYLRRLECKAAIVLDGDGQHDPAEVMQIVGPIIDGKADMVIGSRFIEGAHKIPFYRKIGQMVLNFMTNWGSRVWVSDSQSGFRSFSFEAIKVMKFQEKGFSVESEMQFIAGRQGLRVVEIPISTIYNGKAKRNPFVHGFNVLFRVLWFTLPLEATSKRGAGS